VSWFSAALPRARELKLEVEGALLTNRALAHTKLQQWAEAAEDCTAAIALGGKMTTKAQYRRALARFELGELTGALQDANAVLASYGEATNREAEQLKARILEAIQVKKVAAKKAALEATVVQRTAPVVVPTSTPKTPYEVQRQFNSLKRYPDQLAEYIKLRVTPAVVRSVFKKSQVEAELLEQFLPAITRPGYLSADTVRDYLDAFLDMRSGETQLAMLSDAERRMMKAAVASAAPRPTDGRLRKLDLL
jgi:ElaB/YqjD/DUF883 family membrane-anchored ribosome-binding protein